MPKSGKGFGKPVHIKDTAAPKTQDEGQVLDQVSKDKLSQVRTFLEAGKAAIAASESGKLPATSRAISVKDAAESGDEPEPEAEEPAEKPEAETPATDDAPKPQPTGLDAASIKMLLDTAVSEARKGWEAETDAQKAELQKQIDALKAQVEEGKGLQDIIDSLEKFQGQPLQGSEVKDHQSKGTTLEVLGTGSKESRDYFKLLDMAPTALVRSRRGTAKQRDLRAADAYLWNNRQRIRDGIEAEMREKGFFQGSGSRIVQSKDAITVASDIPSISYEYLSAMMRMTHYVDLIHWQFAKTDIEIGVRPGLTMGISRYDYLARPSAFSDRVLTPGTRINSANSALTEKIVPVTIQELGLGKDSDNPPIGISTFIDAYSMMNLEDIVMRNLGRDYQYTKDLGLRTEWFRTDRVVYNDGGVVTTTATDVGSGDDGGMTDAFTVALNAYLYSLQIPSFDDAGNYGLSLNPTAAAQFMASKGAKERDMALESGMDLVSRAVRQSTGFEGGEVSGYLGLYNGFHMFRQNVYGLVGGTEGVNATTLGDTNSYNLLTSFAFGRDTICWGTAMPVEMRMDTDDDFQREMRAIWTSHEAAESLDVKTTAGTGEQLRVVEVRTTPAAI